MAPFLHRIGWLVLVASALGEDARGSGFASIDEASPGWISGNLTRTDGKPIPGARFRVELRAEGSGEVIAQTEQVDVTGQYRLRTPYPGAHRVRAYAAIPGHGGYHRVELDAVGQSTLPAAGATQAWIKDFRMRAPLQR